MKKRERHEILKQIILDNKISTQEELSERLQAQGIITTQATLSRDIREIGGIKTRSLSGSFYTLSETNHYQSSLSRVFQIYVASAKSVNNQVVVKTGIGEADVVSVALDNAGLTPVLGTIAGVDTLLIICENEFSAKNLVRDIQDAKRHN